MTPEQNQKVGRLFCEAQAYSTATLPRFLASAAKDDPQVHAGLLALLSEHRTLPPARPSQPKQLGCYRIVEELGQGGMGIVYRGVHLETGQEAAIKTVLGVDDPALLETLRREIHSLARLTGHSDTRHPGIVRILDEGAQDGLPWYAMELLEGKTLRSFIPKRPGPELETRETPKTWWTDSLSARSATNSSSRLASGVQPSPASSQDAPAAAQSLAQALTLVRRLCAPLAFLHGEGIVHRDLKPGNIFVRPDGTPVIMDFGLTLRFEGSVSREPLEVEDLHSGTPQYMAPEQIRGELVDARADLYSLGCILYELVTGRPPFLGEHRDVLQKQQFVEPILPSRLVEGLAPELEELILSLLRKNPNERLGHADAVAAVLKDLGAEAWTEGLPEARAYLYRPGFVGRDTALEQLEGFLKRLPGAGSIAMVGGESGIGKTRLVLELVRKAEKAGIEVYAGEAQPPVERGQERPLGLLCRPLRKLGDQCRPGGAATADKLFGPRGKLLSLYEPSLRDLPGLERWPEPTELPPDSARIRLFQALTETFAVATGGPVWGEREDRPMLLILDDLHWADELTQGWLRYAQQQERLAFLILGTYRSEEVTLESASSLHALLAEPEVCRIQLGRLAEPEVSAMVGHMLALYPEPQLFVEFLTRQSEGNPFFVAEYLRTAVAEQLLFRATDGRWQLPPTDHEITAASEKLPLPSSIKELVSRRLSGLPAPAHDLVELGAVFGREFNLEWLQYSNQQAIDCVRELLLRQVIEEAVPGRLRFVHDKLREVAYDEIAPGRRPSLHRTVAEALEILPEQERPSHFAELGHHWERAQNPVKARPYYLAAANRAVHELYTAPDAERFFVSYLALVSEPTPESVEARTELAASCLMTRGATKDAENALNLALTHARELRNPHLEARCLQRLGLLYNALGTFEPAKVCLQQSLAIHRELGDRRSEAALLTNLAVLYFYYGQGQTEQVRVLFEEALAIHQELGNRRYEGMILSQLGNIYMQFGQIERARDLQEQSLVILRQLNERDQEGVALSNLGFLHLKHGHSRLARPFLEQALTILREVGVRRCEGFTLTTLGELSLLEGRIEKAKRLHEEALVIFREIHNPDHEAIALGNLGTLYLVQGKLREAEEALQESHSLFCQHGGRQSQLLALGNLGRLYLAQGRINEARQVLEQSLQMHQHEPNIAAQATVLSDIGRLCLASNQFNEAKKALEQALCMHRQVSNREEHAMTLADLAFIEQSHGSFDLARQFYHEAFAVLDEEPHLYHYSRGDILSRLAALERLQHISEHAAETLLDQGERLLIPLGASFALIKILCERGFLSMAQQQSPSLLCGRIAALAQHLDVTPQSQVGALISRLHRTAAAFETDHHYRLLRGELLDEVPQTLRLALGFGHN